MWLCTNWLERIHLVLGARGLRHKFRIMIGVMIAGAALLKLNEAKLE